MKRYIHLINIKWKKNSRLLFKAFNKLITQSTHPRQISLAIALSFVFGIMPFFGLITILLTILAILLNLNQVIVHVTHNVVFPLQLILLVPFYKAGQWLYGDLLFPGSISLFIETVINDPIKILSDFGIAASMALLIWALISMPVFIIIYYLLLHYLTKRSDQMKKNRN
ncbi:MAG: DUF2062 domain-containing protein [Bacteroidota bacterium]